MGSNSSRASDFYLAYINYTNERINSHFVLRDLENLWDADCVAVQLMAYDRIKYWFRFHDKSQISLLRYKVSNHRNGKYINIVSVVPKGDV
jgi:hypothetical protein